MFSESRCRPGVKTRSQMFVVLLLILTDVHMYSMCMYNCSRPSALSALLQFRLFCYVIIPSSLLSSYALILYLLAKGCRVVVVLFNRQFKVPI